MKGFRTETGIEKRLDWNISRILIGSGYSVLYNDLRSPIKISIWYGVWDAIWNETENNWVDNEYCEDFIVDKKRFRGIYERTKE